MKIRNLIILAILAAALAYLAHQFRSRHERAPASLLGGKALPSLPVNDIGKITITESDSTVVLAKIDGKWRVPSRYNYPADFGKIADAIRRLADLTIGQIVPASEQDLAELSLLKPGEIGKDSEKAGAGTLVELMDEQDQLLGYLVIGKSFYRRPAQASPDMIASLSSYSDGQYIRASGGEVFLVSQSLQTLTQEAKAWLDDEFINMNETDLAEITISGSETEPLRLTRQEEGELALEGLEPEEGSLNISKANRLARSLRYLSFDDVASPSISTEEAGLEQPVIFKANTKQGLTYSLEIGAKTEDGSFRYARARVEFEPPVQIEMEPDESADSEAEPTEKAPKADAVTNKELQAEAESLNAKFEGWTYLLREYRTEPMLFKRTDLISPSNKKKGAEPESPAAEESNPE